MRENLEKSQRPTARAIYQQLSQGKAAKDLEGRGQGHTACGSVTLLTHSILTAKQFFSFLTNFQDYFSIFKT